MQILVQNFNSGNVYLVDTVSPSVGAEQVLVRTHASLISAGTDRAVLQLGKKSSIAKAIARPDLFKKVWQKLCRDGFSATFKAVRSVISQPKPMGYSLVGEVIAVGSNISEFTVGQRVACAGHGFASHAEIVAVPKNLCAQVPDKVPDETACYVTLGAIAMHGLRQAHAIAGSNIMVIGLGLIGQISMQLARASGMQAIGVDFDPAKLALAKQQGFQATYPSDINLTATIAHMTQGEGVDAVLITAGSPEDSSIFEWLVPWCRDRADIVVVGDVKMAMSRRDYFKKELTVWQSRSYGPGRYDPDYELAGNDYPIAAVRWTENRNMQAFLQLMTDKKIDMAALTTHQLPFAEFKTAYEYVMGQRKEFYIGIVLTYDQQKPIATTIKRELNIDSSKIQLGVIGIGNFARTILLPNLLQTKGFQLLAVASKTGLSASSAVLKYQASYASNNAMDIITDSKIKAVMIATRHDSHAEYVKAALAEGKHVFVEKPLCTTVADLNAIVALAKQTTSVLQVGFNRRFSPAITDLKQFFTGTNAKQMMYRINAGRVPLKGEGAWLHEAGGRLLGEVCHFVDTLIAVTGSLPTEIDCHASSPGRHDLSRQDNLILTIRFADGSLGTIHYQTNANPNLPKEYFTVHSGEHSAILNNYKSLTLRNGLKTKRKRYWGNAKGFKQEATAFLQACETGKFAIPLEELIATHQVTLLALNLLNNPKQIAVNLNQEEQCKSTWSAAPLEINP